MLDDVAVREVPTQQDIVKHDGTALRMGLLVGSTNPLSGGDSCNEGPTGTSRKNRLHSRCRQHNSLSLNRRQKAPYHTVPSK